MSLDDLKHKWATIKSQTGWKNKGKAIFELIAFPCVIFILGTFSGVFLNKNFDDWLKSPEDIKRESGIETINEAWKQRNKEVIEAFLELQKEKPTQYVDKLTPVFFK